MTSCRSFNTPSLLNHRLQLVKIHGLGQISMNPASCCASRRLPCQIRSARCPLPAAPPAAFSSDQAAAVRQADVGDQQIKRMLAGHAQRRGHAAGHAHLIAQLSNRRFIARLVSRDRRPSNPHALSIRRSGANGSRGAQGGPRMRPPRSTAARRQTSRRDLSPAVGRKPARHAFPPMTC